MHDEQQSAETLGSGYRAICHKINNIMALNVEKWLSTLHGILKEPYSSNVITLAKETISNIWCHFEDLEDYEAGLVYSHLFDQEDSILCFIQIASTQKVFADHLVIPALILLKNVVESNKCQIWKYVKKIQVFCWNIWRNSEVSSQKERALEILFLVISLYPGFVDLSLIKTMTEEVLKTLSERTEAKPQVLQRLYHMLGVCAKNFPETMSSIHEKIFVALMEGLETQMNKEDRDIVISGCFEGISDYLDSFPLSPPKEENNEDNLSIITKEFGEYKRWWDLVAGVLNQLLIKPRENSAAVQASLKFLSKHSSYVSKYMMSDYRIWNDSLVYWGGLENFSEYKLAEAALESLYHDISKQISVDRESTYQCARNIVFFRLHITDSMMYNRIRATIKSLGHISIMLKAMDEQREIEKIFTYLFCCRESISFRKINKFPTPLLMLPVYMEAISRVFGDLKRKSIEHVVVLQKLCIDVIENIPVYHSKWNVDCLRPLIMITYSLRKKPILQEIFLENLLPQALIISCSPMVSSDHQRRQQKLISIFVDVTICENYLFFWKELFKNPKSSVFRGISDKDYGNTVKHILANLLKAALKVIEKLDLRIIADVKQIPIGVPSGSGDENCDTVNIEMANPKDSQIITNLVLLLDEIISVSDTYMPTGRLSWFMTRVMYFSEKNPHVSEFYKLLSSCLSYFSSANYFKVSESTSAEDNDRNNLLNTVVRYLKIILPEANRFDDGLLLQVSQLEFFLSAPTRVVKHLLKCVSSPIEAIFRFGFKYPYLVLMVLDALERWTLELDWMEWHPILNRILPSLIHLFHGPGYKTKYFGRKNSSNAEDISSNSENNMDAIICRIQEKILLFLAKLPSSSVLKVVCDKKMIPLEFSSAWNALQIMKLKIPPNMKTYIDLDKVLPHIIELSLNSSNGKVRNTSCKIIFSILMLYFEGIEEGSHNPESVSEFVKWIMPILLQLASDSDAVVRQSFYQLLLRLSNMFSSEHYLKAKTYIIWIDCLMDGLSHPHNSDIRRVSGICMKTFTIAASKQVASKESPSEIVHTVVEKICTFSQHSSLRKRVGASLAINCLYSILCDNPLALDQFWMELLYYQVLALEENQSTISKMFISISLQRLGKVIGNAARILNKHSVNRKKPPAFDGVLLKDAVYWILKKCGSLDFSCRRESMALFLDLAPFVEGCHNPKDFIDSVLERSGGKEVIEILEGFNGLSGRPPWIPDTFQSLKTCSRTDQTSLMKWLNCLNSSLDCYLWFFSENLCAMSQLSRKNVNFKIFDALSTFLCSFKNICVSVVDCSQENSCASSYFKDDMEMVLKIGALENVFKKALEYFSVIIEKCQSDVLFLQNLGNSWILKIMDIISIYCFEESFKDTALNVKGFQFAFKGFVESIKTYLSHEAYQTILKSLANNLLKHFDVLPSDLETIFCSEVSSGQMILMRNLLFLSDCYLLGDVMEDARFVNFKKFNFLKCAFNALFPNQCSETTYVELSESKFAYVETFLKLYFLIDPQVNNILALAFDETQVKGLYSQESMVKGEYFYLYFKLCLSTHLLSNLQNSIVYLLEHLKTERGEETLNIWIKIWTDLISDEKAKIICAEESFILSILPSIAQLVPWTAEIFIRKLTLLRVLLSLPLNVLNQENWLILEDLGYWCIGLLASQTESIVIKAKVLEVISYFNHQMYEKRLREALQCTLEKYFSSGGGTQTLKNCDGAAEDIILQSTLIGLEKICNPALLKFYVMASKGISQLHIDDLKRSLSAMIKKVDPEKQFEAMSSIYSLSSDDNCKPETRIASVKNFLKPLIEVSDLIAAKQFYASNIKNIVTVLQEAYITASWSLKLQLVSKTICFNLIEIMFLRFGKELESPTCAISVAYNDGNPNKKELIKEITKRGWEARKKINSQLDGAHDIFQLYRCSAYNALTVIMSILKEEERFYSILFEENPKEDDFVWDSLVDTSTEIILSRSLNKKNVQHCAVNNEEEQTRDDWFDDMECDEESDNFSDMDMDDASLLGLERYDFCDCSVRPEPSPEATAEEALEEQALSEKYIEGIQNHDSMMKICGLIEHMVVKEITPARNITEDSLRLPVWVRGIKEVFENKDKHRNIKIFLMAVLLNCEKFYTPYAKHLLIPIMECIANGDLGLSVNHLLENVVELVLTWSETVSVPVNGGIASKLLELFFTKDGDVEREKFEHYLQFVRSILRLWHGIIEISHVKLAEQIEFNEKKNKHVEFGLLVCCILLEHSVTPWDDSNRDWFFNNLLRNMDHNDHRLKMASACLTGLILRHIDPEGKGLDDEEHFFVAGVIKILSTLNATHKDQFLMCLNEIQMNYINIVDKFLPTILYLLPKLNGSYRTICLEIISSREIAENSFIRLKNAGLYSWLDTKVSRDQEIALAIIRRNQSKFQWAELTEIIEHLFHFHNHVSVNCRRAMYEILKYICEKKEDYSKASGSDAAYNLWIKKCERILSIGLADGDPTITDLVSSYWKEKGGLSLHNVTVECLATILQQFFSPDTERYFLDIIISILLLPNILQEQHLNGNKEPTSGCLSSNRILSSPLKKGQGNRPTPKNWQKNKGFNEMRRISQRKNREAKRQHQRECIVESHRSYQIYDFSSVQQRYKDILFLLKALSKDDPVIGKQLLVSLIGCIIETAMGTHDKSSELWTNLNYALNRIFKEASSLSSCFMGAILEISIGKHDFIKLDNELVVLAGEAAPLSHLVCLYLESKLINSPFRLQARLLDGKKEVKSDPNVWIWLSKLYQQIGENDVVCGILLDCLQPREEIRKALEFERSECWTDAMPYFQEVLNLSETGNFIFQEKDFYYEGYYKCLANLSQWEQLNREVSKQLNGSFSKIWDSQEKKENLFPWIFDSCLRLELESPGKSEGFFNSVCSWMKNEDKRNYMEAYFSKDIAAVYFLSDKWDHAKYFIGKTFDTFLQEKHTHLQGSTKQKMMTALLDIQVLWELSMFLSIFDSPLNNSDSFEKLSSCWKLAPVSHLEPLGHWEERIAFRHIFIRKMKEKINCGAVGDSVNFSANIEDILGKMTQYLIETAIAARNYQVTKKYLRKSEAVLGSNSDPRLRLPWHSSYGNMSEILANGKPFSSPKRISSLMQSVYILGELLEDPELGANPVLNISIYNKVFVSLKALTAVVKDHETVIDSIDDVKRKRFFKFIRYSPESQSLMEKITEYGTMCVGKAIGIAETLPQESLTSQVYLSVAKYCLDLRKYSLGNMDEFCMKAFLRAILYGSIEARDWFPSLLQFDFSKCTLRELFKTETSQIPPWMFLDWTNQILSHLDGFVFDALEEIVIRLADAYPAAILIPYRINFEYYEESVSRMTLNQRINQILSKYKTAEDLFYSLMYISNPEAMFSYHLDNIKSLLEKSKPRMYRVKEACSLMVKEIFPPVRVKRFHGRLHDKLQIYKECSMKMFDIEDLDSARSLVATLNSLKKEIKKEEFSSSLEDHSYWLAKFRMSDHMDVVEIPGQYTGDSEPLTELHTKIYGFSSTVCHVSSLKNSVSITILGTDGEEHRFLIKYGKDLRLDQQVGQLLHIMNKCLLDDLPSIKRDLRLYTNQFIPLSNHHGMIKWNRGLISLYDVFAMSTKEKEIKQRKAVLDQYLGWLKKGNKSYDSLISIYRNAFISHGRDEIVNNFEKLIEELPCDNLRKSFLNLSQSLEDFFCLRSSFASSYAVKCIAYWLLGVGKCDFRKLMMQRASGRVSCIDLGYSFGSAVYSFPVPGLIPFRLTPQILGLMQPFGEIGFMKEAMVHTLRALQTRHDVILSVMTVMVKPFLDWLINIQKDYSIGKTRELVGFGYWNPEDILRITQKKFTGGINPKMVTMELVDIRIKDEANLKEKIKAMVRGDFNHNARAVLGDEGLSCEQQVSCLVDLATDYHILGKTWIDWEPWL